MPENWALTELYYSDSPALTRVIAFSNHPCHITCWRTHKEPVLLTTSRILRGVPVWCVPHFKLFGAHPHEQNEPGDTLVHTFDILNWVWAQSYYIVFVATIAGNPTPSVGPIVSHISTAGNRLYYDFYPASDASIFGDFTEVPPGAPHFWILSHQPPGYDTILLRSEQSAGPFPNPGHGDLFNFPKMPAPDKYAFIDRLRYMPIVRRYHNPFIWDCRIPIASYLTQQRISGSTYYGPEYDLAPTWQSWSTLYDDFELSPATLSPWSYSELDTIQSGLQMRAPCALGSRVYTDCTSLLMRIYYWQLST